jgi:hypothetical protein
MRILQYEGISWLSRCTRFFTWNRTTHTAIELDDGRVCEAWKSREQDGVRIVDSLHAQHTPGTIVKAYTIPELTKMQADDLSLWLIGQGGKPYAFWGGLTRFLTRRDPLVVNSRGEPQPYNPQTFCIADYDPAAWFCSCLAFAGLMHVDFRLLDRIPPWRVSPGHINYSPRLKLDEIIRVGRALRGRHSPGSAPLSVPNLSSEPGRATSPTEPLSTHPTSHIQQLTKFSHPHSVTPILQ